MKLAIAACCLLLAACAPPVTRHERVEYQCLGQWRHSDVIIFESDSSPIDCVRAVYNTRGLAWAVFFALQLPIACRIMDDGIAWVYVPSWATGLAAHELEHVTGKMHLPFVPINMWDECAS